MKKILATKFNQLEKPIDIPTLAKKMSWSEGAVWDLIRLRIVRWGVFRGVKDRVVVSDVEVMDWVKSNPDISFRLSQPVTISNPYALKRRRS